MTASDAEDEKGAAFDLGTDDYLSKPFSSRELLAGITAGLHRYDTQDPAGARLSSPQERCD